MSEKMLAARFHKPGQPLILEEVKVPSLAPDEVLVEVKACGLCGSDVHILKGETFTGKTPIILGHESAGIIAETGNAVENWEVGDRVVINCVTSCGLCYNCQRGRDSICLNRKLIGIHLDGALARYVKVKSRSLVALPEKIPFEQAALLTDAVATPYHALKTRANIKAGESVAIFGIGGLGIHAVMLARAMGATPIIAVDISELALARALHFGADEIINVNDDDPIQAIRKLTNRQGVDVALECVGSEKTILAAAQSVGIGGRVAIVGLSPETIRLMEITYFVRSEITILGSSAFETKEIRELVNLTSSGRLDLSASISETLSLLEVNKGLERLAHNPGDIVRLIVNVF